MMLLVVLLILWASPTWAAVVFSQSFDGMTTQSACATIASEGGFNDCRENPSHPNAPSDVSIVESIPGYAGSMPSGSKVLRVQVDAQTGQGDAGVQLAGGTIDYIPPDAWIQFAMYINNFGAEAPTNLKGRPMKLLYPCKGVYPCGSDTRGGYYMLQTGRTTSYAPHSDTSLAANTDGDMWLLLRDATEGTPSWEGYDPGDRGDLGQTNLTERLRPNRWNIVRCHSNFTNTAAASMECWIGAMGSPLTKVMEWIGGTTVESFSFTWTIPDATGHRYAWIPSTHGAGTTDFPQYLVTYYDDFYIATSEGDLPTYDAPAAAPSRFNPRFLRRASLEE